MGLQNYSMLNHVVVSHRQPQSSIKMRHKIKLVWSSLTTYPMQTNSVWLTYSYRIEKIFPSTNFQESPSLFEDMKELITLDMHKNKVQCTTKTGF